MKHLAVIITILLFAPILHAQESQISSKLYIGVGYANSTVDIGSIEVNALHPKEGSNPASVNTINKTSSGMRIYGGWELAPNISLEISFTDVGQISYSGVVAADNGTYNENVSISTATATVNATIPLSHSQHLLLMAGGHSTNSVSTYS